MVEETEEGAELGAEGGGDQEPLAVRQHWAHSIAYECCLLNDGVIEVKGDRQAVPQKGLGLDIGLWCRPYLSWPHSKASLPLHNRLS